MVKPWAGIFGRAWSKEPAPDILPKKSWEAALGYMGYWLGMENLDYLADHPVNGAGRARTVRKA